MSTRRFLVVNATLVTALPAAVANAYNINSVHGLLVLPLLVLLAAALAHRFDPAA